MAKLNKPLLYYNSIFEFLQLKIFVVNAKHVNNKLNSFKVVL